MTTNLDLHHHVWLPRDGASRTVVALHGTGGDEHDLVPLVREIFPDAHVLGVRGNVSEHGYPRFFRRFAEGVFDEADIRMRARDLSAFFEAAREAYGLGETVWLGYSNGANMIAALMLEGTVDVDAAVLLRAQMPLAKVQAGATQAAKIVMLSGEYDPIVPVAESARLRDALAEQGHEVEQVMLATGHQLSQMDLDVLKAMYAGTGGA